jgi:uncharacterized protein YwqG
LGEEIREAEMKSSIKVISMALLTATVAIYSLFHFGCSSKSRNYSADEVSKAAEKLACPSLRIEKLKTEGKTGESKLGGLPDLPVSLEWPKFKGRPMSFLAQIRLSALASQSLASNLPGAGILYFFYDQEQGAWGFDPKDKGFFSVLFSPEETDLSGRPAPEGLPETARFKESAVCFKEEASYATGEHPALKAMPAGLTDLCLEYIEAKLGKEPRHRLFGYADQIQGDMMLECQLVTHGLYCGDSTGYNDPRAKELEKGVSDWKLLLQIDSDEDLGFMWGDAGRLYFCATDVMLRERRFADVWMIMQCY